MDVKFTTLRDGGFTAEDRKRFQQTFVNRVRAEPGASGRVLDIGCGPAMTLGLEPLYDVFQHLDGVDPSPDVSRHPKLRERWHGELESSGVPNGVYDMAYAYNVVEHIAVPLPFLQRVKQVLRPDGVFWALTPHALHPFAAAVRTVQAIGLKKAARARNEGVNDYPAYYRLNSASAVTEAAEKCGFRSAEFVFMPNVNWDTYFPTWARFIPHTYDRLLGFRFPSRMLLLAFRLQ